jgi:hypothetical protein
MVVPSSSSTQHNKLLEKKTVGMHPEDNWSLSRKQKIKIKSQKSDFKVIRDMLTKKWIFVKKNQ